MGNDVRAIVTTGQMRFGYRFGFNGKEMDNEVSGSGNSYDYGFRIYNPRLGKFLSVDPLTASYPSLTPYQFASNMPIVAVDLDGLEAVIIIQSVTVSTSFLEIYTEFGQEKAMQWLETNYIKGNPKLSEEQVGWLRKATGKSGMTNDIIIVGEDKRLSADLTVKALQYTNEAEGKAEFRAISLEIEDAPLPIQKEKSYAEQFMDKMDEWFPGDGSGSGDAPKPRNATWFERFILNNRDDEAVKDFTSLFNDPKIVGDGIKWGSVKDWYDPSLETETSRKNKIKKWEESLKKVEDQYKTEYNCDLPACKGKTVPASDTSNHGGNITPVKVPKK